MGKILYYIYETMADFEGILACHMLASVIKKEIIPIGYEKTSIKALSGLEYVSQITVNEALSLDDVEGLIIPGGMERECREELIKLIQKIHVENRLVGAICAAPEFLAKADILDKHTYTTTLDEAYFKENNKKDSFPRQNYLEKNVVRHENVITAKGSAFVDFAIEILDYFNVFENAEEKEMCSKAYKGMEI